DGTGAPEGGREGAGEHRERRAAARSGAEDRAGRGDGGRCRRVSAAAGTGAPAPLRFPADRGAASCAPGGPRLIGAARAPPRPTPGARVASAPQFTPLLGGGEGDTPSGFRPFGATGEPSHRASEPEAVAVAAEIRPEATEEARRGFQAGYELGRQ